MATQYGKVKHLGTRRKLLTGQDGFSKTSLVEVSERFEYDGFFFNLHRGRLINDKWGVSESTTGLSASAIKNKPREENNYLHKTKALAKKTALSNLEEAKNKQGQDTAFFIFRGRKTQDATSSLFIELKKYKLL